MLLCLNNIVISLTITASKRHTSAPVNAARLAAAAASSNNASLSAYLQLKNQGAFQQNDMGAKSRKG